MSEIQRASVRTIAVVEAVNSRIDRMMELLPSSVHQRRFREALVIHVASNVALHQCDPGSVVLAAYRLASLGLTPGVDGHLVPRKGVCTFIADWKGLAKILLITKVVLDMNSSLVYQHEPFMLGPGRMVVRHEPSLDVAGRGPLIGVYWIFRLPSGGEIHEVMDLEDIDRLRRLGAPNGPWSSHFNEMAKKGCFKRGAKRLPLDPELRAAIDGEGEGDAELPRRQAFRPPPAAAIQIDETYDDDEAQDAPGGDSE